MNIALTWRGEAIFTRLSFSLVGYAILKDFSYLFGAKFTGRKFYRDLMTIDQEENEWYFTPVRTQLMSIIFFPREFIMCFKFIQAKQVDLESSSLAQSLYDLMYGSSLRSLLRTDERSTCSKSRFSHARGFCYEKKKRVFLKLYLIKLLKVVGTLLQTFSVCFVEIATNFKQPRWHKKHV